MSEDKKLCNWCRKPHTGDYKDLCLDCTITQDCAECSKSFTQADSNSEYANGGENTDRCFPCEHRDIQAKIRIYYAMNGIDSNVATHEEKVKCFDENTYISHVKQHSSEWLTAIEYVEVDMHMNIFPLEELRPVITE